MSILVTGGSGFIGSHIVDKLVERAYDVRVFDKQKLRRDDVEWYKGDVLNDKEVLEACKDVEAVFHLAAIADVNLALFHPELCFRVNEVGTLNVLKAAIAREVNRVILASTTWVYGRTAGKADENTPIPLPEHIYTKTKIGQEQLIVAWHKHYGLPYTILRYGIPYGPRMRSNMAIAIFVEKVTKKEPITIFGDGNQGRCFIYVEDLADGNIAALKDSGKNEIFNIAGPEFISMNHVITVLREILGEAKVGYAPARQHDFKGLVVSIDKARKLLGWEPKTSLKEGIRKYIERVKAEKT
jgi:UDP-glucose 4-epimerase